MRLLERLLTEVGRKPRGERRKSPQDDAEAGCWRHHGKLRRGGPAARLGFIRSVGDDCGCLDLDPSRGRGQRGHLDQGAGWAHLAEVFGMGARDQRGVGHVHDVHHRAHDVAQLRTRLSERVGHQRQGGAGLGVGIPVEVG